MRRRDWLAAAAAVLPLAACHDAPRAIEGGFSGTHPDRGHALRQPRADSAAVERHADVLIAGGGIAGLAAARALRLAGIDDFALLELEDEAGGNSRAANLGGIACPLGAHYLPLPPDSARHVQDLLEELGLRRRVAGRWTYDERHLCHSPQERLYFRGEWHEGLLPVQGVREATLEQYRRFARRIEHEARASMYALPVSRVPASSRHLELDTLTFSAWLSAHALDDPHLRWYLDYCCRDDYGAGLDTVSAWAGVHYFASRHGFQPPGEEGAAGEVLTWPEGNAWLARQLAAPLGGRLHTARVVHRIADSGNGVQVAAVDVRTGRRERWRCRHLVVALPAFVAARVLQAPPAFVVDAGRYTRHAPWVVANLQLREPLDDRPGAAPAWDNVLYGSTGLGYVDARHQALDPRPGPTVLTWYLPLPQAQRAQLLHEPWSHWRDLVLQELAAPHPDLRGKVARIEVTRYGHAMAIPVPGTRARLRELPLCGARLSFAHADWAGYSVFEEAFSLGHEAGTAAARAVRRSRAAARAA